MNVTGAVIEKRSEYYNPWQYRILCPYTVEALLYAYDHTIDKVFPIEEKLHFSIQNTSGTTDETDSFIKLMQTPGALKYMIIFIMFRFAEPHAYFLFSMEALEIFRRE